MKPRFHLGQRVRLARETPYCVAPIGTLGILTAFRGANADGTDWELEVALEGAEAWEPDAWIDEASLDPCEGGVYEPLPVIDACRDADGAWLDTIETTVLVESGCDRDVRLAQAVGALQPLLGESPWSTRSLEHRGRGGRATLELCAMWCASRPPVDVMAALCERLPGSREVLDDGWSVELGLSRDDTRGLFGPDALQCCVIVEPWSSFARRPESERFLYEEGRGLTWPQRV
jgi:hypothetical protein